MSILPALLSYVARKRRERATVAALERLDDRRLADIGLARDEIRTTARLAARLAQTGASPARPATSPWARLARARRYRRERERVLVELRRYSDADLARDALFSRADFAALAEAEARRRLAAAGA